jgi:hypothetical protein
VIPPGAISVYFLWSIDECSADAQSSEAAIPKLASFKRYAVDGGMIPDHSPRAWARYAISIFTARTLSAVAVFRDAPVAASCICPKDESRLY